MKQLLSIAIAAVMLTSAANGGMTITSNYVRNFVQGTGGHVNTQTTNTSVPFSTLLDADNGQQHSRVQIDYTQTASQTVLSNGIDQSRTGVHGDVVQAYESSMNFTVDSDTTYNLSGYFNADDVSATESGQVFLHAYLRDLTTNQYKAYSYQFSRNTNDESFVLGVSGGDQSNSHFGSLTGLLTAGHSYRFFWNAYVYALGADDGASALGKRDVDFGWRF